MEKVLEKFSIQMIVITSLILGSLLWISMTQAVSAQVPPPLTPTITPTPPPPEPTRSPLLPTLTPTTTPGVTPSMPSNGPPTPAPLPPPPPMLIDEPMPMEDPSMTAPPIPGMGWCSSKPTDEGMSISGSVVDPDGEPVANIYVQVYNSANDYWCYDVYTDEAGAFQVYNLSTDTWNFLAPTIWNDDGTQYFQSQEVEVVLEDGDEAVELSEPLQLTGPQATGQVLLPDGLPSTNGSANIYTLADGQTECADINNEDPMFGGYAYGFPYMDGTFEIGGLTAGSYCLQVTPPWDQGTLGAPTPSLFTLSDDSELLDLGTFQLIAPSKTVEVIVSYTTGDGTAEGLANINVSLYADGKEGWTEGVTDDSGTFTTQVSGGSWHVSIYPNYESSLSMFLEDPMPRMITFADDETEESQTVNFDVEVPTSSVEGRIVDGNGEPLTANNGGEMDYYGGGISININSISGRYYASAMADESGDFQTRLPADEYELTIYVDTYLYPEYYAPPPQTITLAEDQTLDLGDIQLGEIDSFVTGRLVNADGGSLPAPSSPDGMEWYDESYTGLSVMAYNDQMHIHRDIDASGSFTLALAPGEYQMEFYLEPMLYPGNFAPAPQTVQVVAEETVELGDILLLPSQISGTITTPDGDPVAHAGFQIYGVAGETACSMEEWEYMYERWSYGSADEAGQLSMGGLSSGDYCLNLDQYWGMGGLFAPDPIRFTIEEGAAPVELGAISYQTPSKTIQGIVLSDNEAGDGIANVMVNAYQRDGRGGWAETTTDENGAFTLAVTGGTWDLNIYPGYQEDMNPFGNQPWYSDKSYQVISFEQDQTAEAKSIEFRVKVADSTITGRIVGPDGTPLTMESMGEDMPMEEMPPDMYGYDYGYGYGYSAISVNIYSREGYGNSAMVGDDGTFSVQVIGGNYDVSVYVDEYMYPDYYSPEMQSIRVEDSATADLGDITVGVKNAKISGQVLDPASAGIADIPIYGWSQNGGSSSATTDEMGVYTMTVRSGDWEISTETYMDPTESAGYFLTQPPQQVTVGENETATVDFVAQGVAGAILGEIVDSDSLLITDLDVQAYARRIGDVEEGGGVVLAAERQSYPIPPPYPEMFYDHGYYYYGYDVTAQSVSEQGRFTLEVPSGVYQVGLYLPPGSDYVFASEAEASVQNTEDATVQASSRERVAQASTRGQVAQANAAYSGEQQVILGATGVDEDVSVKLVLLRNDATITGTLLGSNGEPATGIYGEVSAWMDGPSDSWQSASIDPETATYEMTVAGGTWYLDYYVDSEEYVGYGAGETLSVTVESKSTTQQDITLRSLDGIIQGTVTDPEGNPVEWGHVWANVAPSDEPIEMFFYGTGAEVIDGEFEMQVVSGLSYVVGTYGEGNYIQPATQVVTPSADSPAVVNLVFRLPDGMISGTITAMVDEVAQPAAYGYVYGWSDDGQSAEAEADEAGSFAFEVASGSIWHLGASWAPSNGQVYYMTTEDVTIDLTDKISGTAELTLEAEDFLMPPPMVSAFETDQSWTQALADGTRIDIPAGAVALGGNEAAPDAPTAEMPTAPAPVPIPSQPAAGEETPTGGDNGSSNDGGTDGDAAVEESVNVKAREARLNITPMVENMPCTLTACPVGYGYNVAVYNSGTGEQVISNFNEDVTMTFHYTDEEVTKADTDEDSIAPAYYSSATKSWTRIDSFTVDADANQITAQIGHAGQWALVSSAGTAIQTPTSLDEKPDGPEPDPEYLLFLPITMK